MLRSGERMSFDTGLQVNMKDTEFAGANSFSYGSVYRRIHIWADRSNSRKIRGDGVFPVRADRIDRVWNGQAFSAVHPEFY